MALLARSRLRIPLPVLIIRTRHGCGEVRLNCEPATAISPAAVAVELEAAASSLGSSSGGPWLGGGEAQQLLCVSE